MKDALKRFETINLDDESECEAFINAHGTTKGRRLANKLGFSGKGSEKRADSLACYAWNKWTAIGLRKRGEIGKAMAYEAIANRIYNHMPKDIRW